MRVVRIIGALAIAALVASGLADRRGWPFGILAFLFYGTGFVLVAASFDRVRQWSAEHVVLDALGFIPIGFFALLLIPALPWWGAALIAVAAGLLFVPIAVSRARSRSRRRGNPPASSR